MEEFDAEELPGDWGSPDGAGRGEPPTHSDRRREGA